MVYATVQSALGLALGVLLLWVGRMVSRRKVRPDFATPQHMFVAWWVLLGAAWAVWAVDTLAFHWGPRSAGWLAAFDYGLILLYFLLVLMAFASLLHYLLFLYFGKVRLSGVVWGLYGVLTIVVAGLFIAANPYSTFAPTGITDAIFGDYQAAADGLRVILLLPVVVAALALFFVARRVESATSRYRTLMLSSSLALYLFAPLLFPSNPGIIPDDAWGWASEVLNKVVLLVAVAAAYLTYHPPAWVRARYGVQSLEDGA